ncbi:MAG TPA: AAA family ATPase [Acetobacteraceae bacterium]|nr:AAA family ATPase [Acetobacteraceae bacterium]
MLTRLQIRRFKVFSDVDIELGPVTVLCGPNNSGKTAALQAIALWQLGLKAWQAERGKGSTARERVGVPINRRDLVSIPVPETNLLWHGLHVREGFRQNGHTITRNLRIDITVSGVGPSGAWECGLEFDYSGPEVIYVRPQRLSEQPQSGRMPVPVAAAGVRVALLPAMSGLAAVEPKWEPGRVEVLIGEGQTAQVLRNLCHQLWQEKPDLWDQLVSYMRQLFRVTLLPPQSVVARGEITMAYQQQDGASLDLSSAGRGQQQILLLLTYVLANPGTTLLLDEPDAHLEVVRQRETYNLLSELAQQHGSQIIAASHSEVVLEEAARKDTLVAFVGRPHRIDDRGSQVRKWLAEYPIDHLYQAELQGWVLYLEGSTDLAVLLAFAEKLDHPARKVLERPFVMYVANDPSRVQRHYYALREAKADVVGVALFDRLDRSPRDLGAEALMWSRREIENYLARRDVLEAWAKGEESNDLFAQGRVHAMRVAIDEIEAAQRTLGKDIWSSDIKATDEVLDPIFRRYFALTKEPLLFRKADHHRLVRFMPPAEVDPEVAEMLDRIVAVALRAQPRTA